MKLYTATIGINLLKIYKETFMVKCTFCEKLFQIQIDLMNHRIEEQSTKVNLCSKSLNGRCKYKFKSWLKYEENEYVDQDVLYLAAS